MSSDFQLGSWVVQPSQNAISCNGKTTRLEPKMVEVLVCLAEHAGGTVSKDELHQRVWGDTFVTDDVLTRCISELRRALEDDPREPHVIQTIARKGYRLVPQVSPVKKKTSRRYLIAPLVLLATLVAGLAYIRLRHPPAAIHSLAVLPLKNLSGDPEQEYFADGLTDELTAALAKLGTLRVISRSSAALYRDTPKPLPQVATELNVEAVVTGSVERSGNRVRVRTRMVRAGTDEVLWAESYDRDLGDVLRLEGEVSQAIAREIGIKLTPQVQRRLEHKPTPNPEAREAYLRARYFFDRDDKEGATKCLQYFQEAIAKDPNYAAAYAGLSRCIDLGTSFNLMSELEAAPKIKAAAMKAVELDEELGEGHAELGDYYFNRAWDFSAAEREYKRALELDPNSSVAHSYYSFFLQRIGRADESVKEIYRARELDPLSLDMADNVAWTLLYSRRYDEAVDQFHRVLEMNPNFRRARWGLARTHELKGTYTEAISECLKIPALPNIDAFAKAMFKTRCSLYEKVFTTSDAEHVNRNWFESARQEIKDSIKRDDDSYFIATLYAASGATEKALDLLERGYAQHDSSLLELKIDPRLDNLRSSPRFQELVRRMNFPEYAQSKRTGTTYGWSFNERASVPIDTRCNSATELVLLAGGAVHFLSAASIGVIPPLHSFTGQKADSPLHRQPAQETRLFQPLRILVSPIEVV